MMPGFKQVQGYQWPDSDTDCMAVVFQRTPDLHLAYDYCAAFDVVVQAGGNCGVWPKYLASKFNQVYTAEPEPTNFACLLANCTELNIHVVHAALGETHQSIAMRYPEGDRNMGACQIGEAGEIPMVRIDDWQLPACNLIQLDVEGYEIAALKGAMQTIRAYHPVIMVEDKGLSEPYGYPKGWSDAFLADEGYRIVARPERDVILAYGGAHGL